MTDPFETSPADRSGASDNTRHGSESEITQFDGRASAALPETYDGSVFLRKVGDRVRMARTRKGLSRKALSEKSGVSQRYLAQLETGSGNISIVLLRRVALSLDIPVDWLLTEEDPWTSETLALVALYQRADSEARRRARAILEEQRGIDRSDPRQQRIAFIGLRGAGKSTLGRRSAEQLGLAFLELNDEIRAVAGMPVTEVFALYGQEGYRRLERQAVERVAATHPAVVLAVAGGIVSEPETFDYLLSHYHTVWLRAGPEEHMERVRRQGDERPMAGNPAAMDELKSILKSREALYARAKTAIDTSSRTEDESLADVIAAIDALVSEDGESSSPGAST